MKAAAALPALAGVAIGLAVGLSDNSTAPPATTAALGPVPTGCHARARGALPDPRCTPGAGLAPGADIRSTVCRPGWAATQRPPLAVTEPLKRKLIRAYGYRDQRLGHYELDHLIPIELGGASTTANLWPERHPASFRKDQVENQLHREVCSGVLELGAAQYNIGLDWRRAIANTR